MTTKDKEDIDVLSRRADYLAQRIARTHTEGKHDASWDRRELGAIVRVIAKLKNGVFPC